VVDRGTFVYQGDTAWRDRFRSTRAHSTVMVDGVEQNEMRGAFWMPPDGHVTVDDWTSEPGRDVFAGRHSCYERLADPVTHGRTIVLEHEPFALAILDVVSAGGEHEAESRVQLDPGGTATVGPPPAAAVDRAVAALAGLAPSREGTPAPELDGDGAAIYEGRAVRLAIIPFGGELAVESGWHAPLYGVRVEAPVARLRAGVEGRHAFGYVIVDAR
jgi:hypothetical protein